MPRLQTWMWWVGGIGAGILAALGGKKVYDKVQLAKIEGDAAERHGFPRWWFIALGLKESGLDPSAVNLTGTDAARGGAWGMNQITEKTARLHGYDGPMEDLLEPIKNADWTGRILSAPKDRWGNLRVPPDTFVKAASMWNGGFYPGDVAPPGHKPLDQKVIDQVEQYAARATGFAGIAERLA